MFLGVLAEKYTVIFLYFIWWPFAFPLLKGQVLSRLLEVMRLSASFGLIWD